MKPADAFRAAVDSFNGNSFTKEELRNKYYEYVDGGEIDNHFNSYFRDFNRRSIKGLKIDGAPGGRYVRNVAPTRASSTTRTTASRRTTRVAVHSFVPSPKATPYNLFEFSYGYLLNATHYVLNHEGYTLTIGQTKSLIDDYLYHPNVTVYTFENMLEELGQTFQTANMKIGVINFLRRRSDLNRIFRGYNIGYIVSRSEDDFLRDCQTTFGSEIDGSLITWRNFIKCIKDGASLMNRYSSVGPAAFREDIGSSNVGTAIGSPTGCNFIDLSTTDLRASLYPHGFKIEGIGPALAPNYLKEIGFLDYGKPDTHTMETFVSLGLCSNNHDYTGFHSSIRHHATIAGTTPYALDKAIWLICSLFYYRLHNKKYGSKYDSKAIFLSSLQDTVRTGLLVL